MNIIKGILVSIVAPMNNHIANGGEKLLGNASSIKRRNDGKVYISGQMQRHVLFSAINRLNLEAVQDYQKNNSQSSLNETVVCGVKKIKDTYISNGDGIGNAIEVDIRADMGGFMHPSAGNYSGRRTAPLSVTPAVAIEESRITRDLLVRLKVDTTVDSRDQALATKEQSDSDLMIMNFFLDISNLSISKKFIYNGGFHVQTDYVKHVNEVERKRRVKLFLEATRSLVDYANEARNAVTGEPQKVLIVFDTKMSRKACRYFEASEAEKINILAELKDRGAEVYIGDDLDKIEIKDVNQISSPTSVNLAYSNSITDLIASSLYDPCGGDGNIQAFSEAFPATIKDKTSSQTEVKSTPES